MRYALRAELTKARTVPGPLTLGIALVVTYIAATVAAIVGTGSPRGQVPVDVVRLALSGVVLAQVCVVVMAVQLVGVEYSTGILQVSLLAVPRRWPVAAAKGLVIIGWTLAAAVPAVFSSLLAGRILLPRQGYSSDHGYAFIDLADGSTLRAAGGAVLYLVLVGVISGGTALAVRDTVVTTVGLLALLYLFPVLIVLVNNAAWQHWLTRVGPMPAGSALWGTISGTVTAGQGAATMAAWAAGAVLVGLTALLWRSA
jgi:ABC-2 type transport system permease protein